MIEYKLKETDRSIGPTTPPENSESRSKQPRNKNTKRFIVCVVALVALAVGLWCIGRYQQPRKYADTYPAGCSKVKRQSRKLEGSELNQYKADTIKSLEHEFGSKNTYTVSDDVTEKTARGMDCDVYIDTTETEASASLENDFMALTLTKPSKTHVLDDIGVVVAHEEPYYMKAIDNHVSSASYSENSANRNSQTYGLSVRLDYNPDLTSVDEAKSFVLDQKASIRQLLTYVYEHFPSTPATLNYGNGLVVVLELASDGRLDQSSIKIKFNPSASASTAQELPLGWEDLI